MKYKLLGAISVAAAIVIAVCFSLNFEQNSPRYHQHIEANGHYDCAHTSGEFCTHLPIVKIETGGKTIPGTTTGQRDAFGEELYTLAEGGSETISATISVYDTEGANNHLTDTPALTELTQIRIRGHASRHFEKAQYLIKFVDEAGLEKDTELMGMTPHNEWVLNGPYLDKSLVRNYMFYNISGEIMEYAPNVRYCEVYVDGDYRGVYVMTESIANKRLPLTVTEKGETISGHLFKLDRPTEENLTAVRNIDSLVERAGMLQTDVSIKYPGVQNLTPELARKIELEFAQFEKSIYSYDYDTDKYGYKNYIDANNFADYFIINEFTKNMDAGRYSTFIYRAPYQKYKMCVWDFNNCCENFPDDISGYSGFSLHNKVFYIMLTRDEDFVEKVISRYRELREGVLSEQYLMDYIDNTCAFLGDAIARNSSRWAQYIASDPLAQPERNVHSQAEAVSQLKGWLIDRGNWLDQNIETLRQYCADSKVKRYNENTD